MLRSACRVAVHGSKRAVVAPRRNHTNARPTRALHTAAPRVASSPAFAPRPARSVTLVVAHAVRAVVPNQAPTRSYASQCLMTHRYAHLTLTQIRLTLSLACPRFPLP